MEISGQMALVSGGGSGLGAATARHLASLGAKVAILDFDITRAQAVAKEIGGVAVQADVGDETAVNVAMESASEQLGNVARIAVNCAGVGLAARIVGREGKLSFDVFEKTLRVNLFGTYNVMSHAARRMAELEPLDDSERGVIINTTSVAFEDGQLGQAAYAASKGAIVMAIAPGLFQTPMMEGLPPEVTSKITANIPFPARLGAPEEYALLAAQIVNNRFLNGTTIRLDGAVRLPPR